MARAKRWGELSRATRERYAAQAEAFHIPRENARRMYNRGTWNPGSPDGEQRIPRKFRGMDLDEMAYDNMAGHFGDRLKWAGDKSAERVDGNIARSTDTAKAAMAFGTGNELDVWADAGSSSALTDKQREREALAAHPGWAKRDVGWFDANDRWHSVFWYH